MRIYFLLHLNGLSEFIEKVRVVFPLTETESFMDCQAISNITQSIADFVLVSEFFVWKCPELTKL